MGMATKSIDRLLAVLGIAVGTIFAVLNKTPAVVVMAMVSVFALLIHPLWNFWWIEERPWRRFGATALLILGLLYIGQVSWPLVPGQPLPVNPLVALWGWLAGPHGRWFDWSLGAMGATLFAAVVIALMRRGWMRRLAKEREGRKVLAKQLIGAERQLAAARLELLAEDALWIADQFGGILEANNKQKHPLDLTYPLTSGFVNLDLSKDATPISPQRIQLILFCDRCVIHQRHLFFWSLSAMRFANQPFPNSLESGEFRDLLSKHRRALLDKMNELAAPYVEAKRQAEEVLQLRTIS
jgi:hypothetical protein